MKKYDKVSRSWNPPDTISSKEADILDESRKGKDRVEWLNPIAMSQLQTAVKAKKKTVVLNGKTFTLTYGIMFHSSITDTYEQVLIKPAKGYVPMGYVALNKILNFDFEAKEK
jgi:hypothetical protein